MYFSATGIKIAELELNYTKLMELKQEQVLVMNLNPNFSGSSNQQFYSFQWRVVFYCRRWYSGRELLKQMEQLYL